MIYNEITTAPPTVKTVTVTSIPEVIGVYTTSQDPLEMLKNYMRFEILRLRRFRKNLRNKYSDLFKDSI